MEEAAWGGRPRPGREPWDGWSANPSQLASFARLTAIVVLVAALGVTPWLVRNALVHGEFVAVKSSFGYAFWQGNCALSEGTDKVVRPSVETALGRGERGEGLSGLNRTLWAARHEAGYLDDIALTPEDRKLLGSVSEPERSRILFRRAIRELASEPGRYLRLCLRRFRYFWLFDETNPKTRVLAYRLSHLGLTAVADPRPDPCPRRHAFEADAGAPDRRGHQPLPYPDDRLGAVPRADRAADGGVGRGGADAVVGASSRTLNRGWTPRRTRRARTSPWPSRTRRHAPLTGSRGGS